MKNRKKAYFHTGKVMITEGSAEFIDGSLAEGTFVVDMSSIMVVDENLPEDKSAMLAGHLASPGFL